MSIGTGLLYVVLADSEVQPWNNPDIRSTDQERELKALNKEDKNQDRSECIKS